MGEILDRSELTIENIMPFNIKIIAEGGQAFRWNYIKDCNYIGVVGDRVLQVCQDGDKLIVRSNKNEEVKDFLIDYFDLARDYKKIENELLKYKEIADAVLYCSGYRILFQDPWETIISFIISANNQIRNIKNTIENICQKYGNPLEFQGKTYYSFPGPEILASLSCDELKETRCGYRAKYIIETAKMVTNKEVDIYSLGKLSTDEARKELLRFPGVGRKVADCILLYSMRKFDAFPIDVWIKRVLEHIYFNGKEVPIRKLQNFAESKFGNLAGFAQQYLFYYARNHLRSFANAQDDRQETQDSLK
ncbi:DNA-3-methyladenine glycosylase family protein [Tepidanaerobacter syntrophicus]|uniref:DNA-3-methyladenine glycosylase family protein n=1 Tax=Tepidanaerobacter syntrophicus TaxID=224999 RepID=UPI0023539652